MFVNLLGISDVVSCVIDDDENKQNLSLPGSNIMIRDSSFLVGSSLGVCLLAVNIAIEEKIANLVREKSGKNLQVFSISPDSPLALENFKAVRFLAES